MSYIYLAASILAALLTIGFCFLVKRKSIWLLLLYVSIFIVDTGYYLLSISKTLEFALFANRMAYLGSVFLCMFMLLTIIELCGFKIKKTLYLSLFTVGALIYAIIFTQGLLPWYYEDVTLEIIDGTSTLNKVYGPLHFIYLIYLVLYFSSMIAIIICSLLTHRDSTKRKHAIFLASVVFVNIAVWFIEQNIPFDFEFLSISYIMSEIMLLCLYWMIQDYELNHNIISKNENKLPKEQDSKIELITKIQSHLPESISLTERETEVLSMLLQNKKRRHIAEALHISENTVKTHTSHIFNKFNVSCRDELINLLYD